MKLVYPMRADGLFILKNNDYEQIAKEFLEKYGADYVAKIVAKPGYSEHHSGLALDLYLIVDGKNIINNEGVTDDEQD